MWFLEVPEVFIPSLLGMDGERRGSAGTGTTCQRQPLRRGLYVTIFDADAVHYEAIMA